MNSGRASNGDMGFYKNGDKIRSINFDDFVIPKIGGRLNPSYGKMNPQEFFEYMQFYDGLIEHGQNVYNVIQANYENEKIPMQFDSVTPLNNQSQGHFPYVEGQTKVHWVPRKDSATEKSRRNRINDSIRNAQILKK